MLENIRLSFVGIRSHKLRSFLTMLGVIIGIASIITIVSIVAGTNAKLEKNLMGAGNNVTTVSLYQDSMPFDAGYSELPAGVPILSDDVPEQLRSINHIEEAALYRTRQWQTVYHLNTSLNSCNITGISDSYIDTYQYEISKGRPFKAEEYAEGRKVAIIDRDAANALFDSEDPLGNVIEINGEPFVIVGISNDPYAKEADYKSIEDYYQYGMENRSGNVYVPMKVWPIIYQFDEPVNVALRVSETSQMTPMGKKVAKILNGYVSSDTVQYESGSTGEDSRALDEMTNTIQMMLIAIASLSLLVGGIGVMNIMLVSVTERTSEIGLKKALGAKNRMIMTQFLTESAVLTSVGGIIGVILGVILARIITYAFLMEFGISVPWMIISVGFSIVIGLIFGAMPAYRAAKLSPIEALRHE